jgi:hypothetical protein
MAEQLTALQEARTQAGEAMTKARTPGDSFKASTAASGAQAAIAGLEDDAEREAGRLALAALAGAGSWTGKGRDELRQLDEQAFGLLRQAVEVMGKRYAKSVELRQAVETLGALCADLRLDAAERLPRFEYLCDAPWPGGAFPWPGPKEYQRVFLEKFNAVNDAQGTSTLEAFRNSR